MEKENKANKKIKHKKKRVESDGIDSKNVFESYNEFALGASALTLI